MPTPSDPTAAPVTGKNTLNLAPETNDTFNEIQRYLMNADCTYGSKIEHPVNEKD